MYSLPSKIIIIKSSRMRWSGHVAQMGEKKIAYRFRVRVFSIYATLIS
jgi:hypothetical protein